MLGYTNCSRSNVLVHFQEYFQKSNATDASGNMVLSDIGVHLQQKVSLFFIFSHCNVHEALGGMALPVLVRFMVDEPYLTLVMPCHRSSPISRI